MSATAAAEFPALGTTARVVVTDPDALEPVVDRVREELHRIDLTYSRFRDDSELTALNRAGGGAFRVGPLLFEVVDVALRAARATGGDVDPTVGRSLADLGWDRDFALVVSRPAPGRLRAVPAAGWRRVEVDRKRSLVRLPRGAELDLGATGKGLAADLAACAATDATRGGVLVSLGGDIAVAGPAPTSGWPVRVTDDHSDGPDAPGQTVAIASGALATSSTTVRRWRAGGRELHHILDPRTGLPAPEVWRTVSVCARTCAEANAAATAAIVRGEPAASWLEREGLPARLVRCDGRVVTVAGWPREMGRGESGTSKPQKAQA